MTDITIPGWALVVFAVILLPWMVYLTLQVIALSKEQGIQTATNSATNNYVAEELKKIYDTLETNQTTVNQRFDQMTNKFDLFLSQEITFLKQIQLK
jgi:hypothetical protein